jgi:hypothetical protein
MSVEQIRTIANQIPSSNDHKGWIAIGVGVLIGVLVFVLWLLKIEPFFGWVNPVMVAVNQGVQVALANIASVWNGMLKAAAEQPSAAIAGVLAVGSAGVGLASKIQSDRAKIKAETAAAQAATEANRQMLLLSQENDLVRRKAASLQKKVEEYASDTFAEEAKGIIAKRDQELESARTTINELERLIKSMRSEKVVSVV